MEIPVPVGTQYYPSGEFPKSDVDIQLPEIKNGNLIPPASPTGSLFYPNKD